MRCDQLSQPRPAQVWWWLVAPSSIMSVSHNGQICFRSSFLSLLLQQHQQHDVALELQIKLESACRTTEQYIIQLHFLSILAAWKHKLMPILMICPVLVVTDTWDPMIDTEHCTTHRQHCHKCGESTYVEIFNEFK